MDRGAPVADASAMMKGPSLSLLPARLRDEHYARRDPLRLEAERH
jgi:hypothetical protein